MKKASETTLLSENLRRLHSSKCEACDEEVSLFIVTVMENSGSISTWRQ